MRPLALTENDLLIRIVNHTGLDFDSVRLVYDEGAQQANYRRLPAGKQSGYHALEEPARPLQVHTEARPMSGDSYRSSSITLQGLDANEAHHFTFLVRMIDGQLHLDLSEDDQIVTEAALVGLWYWVDARLANGEAFDPVLEERPPYVEFFDTLAPYYNTPGLEFYGNTGCNRIGGIYHTSADTRLIVRDTSTTFAGCPVPNQGRLLEALASNPSYRIEGDALILTTPTGERLTFSRTPSTNPN